MGGFRPNAWARFQRCMRVVPMHGPYLYDLTRKGEVERGEKAGKITEDVQIKYSQNLVYLCLFLSMNYRYSVAYC